MKNRKNGSLLAMAAVLALVVAAPVASQDGRVSDASGLRSVVRAIPGLSVSEWYAHPLALDRDQEHIYIVEFWATWCGPCRQSIPALNLIHRLFGDRVTLIAVTDEESDDVIPFMEERSGGMQFAVVRDDESRSSWENFMAAYNQGGIPHAFVVQGGEVVWHGHSASIMYNALPDLLTRSLIDERMADRPVAPFSGTVTHAGETIVNFSHQRANISVRDNVDRAKSVSSTYNQSTGTFDVAAAPLGSYSISVTLDDPDGRRYRGSTNVFAEAGTNVTVDITEVIRLLEPVNTREGIDPFIEVRGTSPEMKWAPVGTAQSYSWYLYKIVNNRLERVEYGSGAEPSVKLGAETPLERNATYELRVYGWGEGGQVGQLETFNTEGRRLYGFQFTAK